MATLLAELDCFLSLSEVALSNRYCKPEITETGILEFQNARYLMLTRHPILELSCDSFVDNNISMVQGTKQIAITGPNSSGKTVFMEQVKQNNVDSFDNIYGAYWKLCSLFVCNCFGY
jgi:DNA mismatch repair protein MutS